MDKKLLREKMSEILIKRNEQGLAEFLFSERKKVLFGQGTQAIICYDFCERLDISIDVFMCSDKGRRRSKLPANIPFYLPCDLPDPGEYDVLLALNEMHNQTVIDLLKQHGFVHIYYSEDWNRTNRIYRREYLELYLKEKIGETFSVNEPLISAGNFKILGLQEPEEYSSMIEGEFFDIIAPSIFHDDRY